MSPIGVNYTETLDDRNKRRQLKKNKSVPWTLIEPLDSIVSTIGPKQLGLVLAPWKRGKSLFLLWLAVAYALQGIKVLHVTLEDPLSDVEDRLDAITTHIPIKMLEERPLTTKRRFQRFRAAARGMIRIIDGTEGGVTIAALEQMIHTQREDGFLPGALLVDYDEEIEPERRQREKRYETDEIYRGLRQRIAAAHNMITWTAAQTQRDTRKLKILSGDKIAEDIGKMKKVTCGISLGKGEWTEDSYYLWVAAHKHDRMEIGCEVVPDLKRMLIYDDVATRREMKEHRSEP